MGCPFSSRCVSMRALQALIRSIASWEVMQVSCCSIVCAIDSCAFPWGWRGFTLLARLVGVLSKIAHFAHNTIIIFRHCGRSSSLDRLPVRSTFAISASKVINREGGKAVEARTGMKSAGPVWVVRGLCYRIANHLFSGDPMKAHGNPIDTIECPNCGHAIPMSEALSH
jgi:hypothetical protein